MTKQIMLTDIELPHVVFVWYIKRWILCKKKKLHSIKRMTITYTYNMGSTCM